MNFPNFGVMCINTFNVYFHSHCSTNIYPATYGAPKCCLYQLTFLAPSKGSLLLSIHVCITVAAYRLKKHSFALCSLFMIFISWNDFRNINLMLSACTSQHISRKKQNRRAERQSRKRRHDKRIAAITYDMCSRRFICDGTHSRLKRRGLKMTRAHSTKCSIIPAVV